MLPRNVDCVRALESAMPAFMYQSTKVLFPVASDTWDFINTYDVFSITKDMRTSNEVSTPVYFDSEAYERHFGTSYNPVEPVVFMERFKQSGRALNVFVEISPIQAMNGLYKLLESAGASAWFTNDVRWLRAAEQIAQYIVSVDVCQDFLAVSIRFVALLWLKEGEAIERFCDVLPLITTDAHWPKSIDYFCERGLQYYTKEVVQKYLNFGSTARSLFTYACFL